MPYVCRLHTYWHFSFAIMHISLTKNRRCIMAYTALEEMRKINRERYGKDLGPMQPPLYTNRRNRNDLKSAVSRFIHNSCEELHFNAEKTAKEKETGVYQGKSLRANQIPYNMQMDINRMCLEKALERFIDSGVAEDAYAVYYCYLEIFFGEYGRSKNMVELLSEYEANGSSLLMKHRDHYSHSVYVFALGLAIYETNDRYRSAFQKFYHVEAGEGMRTKNCRAANLFLEYWGLTALFHDVGYPFELPFEQILSYFEVGNENRGKDRPFLAYHAIETLTRLDEYARGQLEKLYHRSFATTDDLLAYDITQKLGKSYDFTEEYMLDVISRKPTHPEKFGYFMDHAFFSATRLFQELAGLKKKEFNKMQIDALSAIMLHNSLFKFSISFYKDKEKRKPPLKVELHPLAYLLMLCDELQCWDRTAYGRNSRKELHPMAADFDFSDNAVTGIYYYDLDEREKIQTFDEEYLEWEENPDGRKETRLKAYSEMAGKRQSFTGDIERIVDTSIIPLTIIPNMCKVDRKSKHTYLSGSNFLHLYDFAVALHGRSLPADTPVEKLEEKFRSQSLEYQLSGINRAGSFGRYLDAIRCFYTDKPVDYEMVKSFSPRDAAEFAPMEHERWIREHHAMGWCYGNEYEKMLSEVPEDQLAAARSALREQTRTHKLAMNGNPTTQEIRRHFIGLPKKYQDKDWKPFNNLLQLLKKKDGLRIYRLD